MAKSTFLALRQQINLSKPSAPWSFLPKNMPFSQVKFHNILRTNTTMVALKFYEPIIKAVEAITNQQESNPNLPPYRLVQVVKKKKDAPNTYILEYVYASDERLVLKWTEKGELQCTIVDSQDNRTAYNTWKNHPELLISCVMAIIPYIVQLEADKQDNQLQQTMKMLEPEFQNCYSYTCVDDFPDAVVDNLAYLSIIYEMLNQTEVELNQSGVPDMISFIDAQNPFYGNVICENCASEIMFVKGLGKAKLGNDAGIVTIGEAKAMFADYSASRQWSDVEKALIPDLPDDMPVMKETLFLCNKFVSTRNDVSPIKNVMWRGVTSYGKSTGTEQLAAILNMPLVRHTCSPEMERMDLLCQFVPNTDDVDSSNVVADTSTAVSTVDSAMQTPQIANALAHVNGMSDDEKQKVLDSKGFCFNALFDFDASYEELTGEKVTDIDGSELFDLYNQVYALTKVLPLLDRVKALEAENRQLKVDIASSGKEPMKVRNQFKMVEANYAKAIRNGWICEIQEMSRVRDQGVFAGLNELDRPNSKMQLIDGSILTRHPDALIVATDNVGLESCHQIDASVRRRFGCILDSFKMDKDVLFARIRRNTGCNNLALLERAYSAWDAILNYCIENEVAEYCVSATELERLVQAVMHDGEDSFAENLEFCVISKATDDMEIQDDIRGVVATLVNL